MKKPIIALSAILLAAFIVVISINAQDKPQDNKKVQTEAAKQCPKGPSAPACCRMKNSTAETGPCVQAKCKEQGFDHPCGANGSCKAKSDAPGCPKKCSSPGSEKGSYN